MIQLSVWVWVLDSIGLWDAVTLSSKAWWQHRRKNCQATISCSSPGISWLVLCMTCFKRSTFQEFAGLMWATMLNPWFDWSFCFCFLQTKSTVVWEIHGQPPWCPWLFLHLLFCPRTWPWCHLSRLGPGEWFRAIVIPSEKLHWIEPLNSVNVKSKIFHTWTPKMMWNGAFINPACQ